MSGPRQALCALGLVLACLSAAAAPPVALGGMPPASDEARYVAQWVLDARDH